ncbi:MAG: hypothetical protein H6636_10770 [Anaerolineales bacterium]|nr:hypothetical protein [Anaerolineales bacterium]
MPNRHPDQDRWEVLFTTIFLKYRSILFIGGVILVGFAVSAWMAYPVVSIAALGLALLLFMMVSSDKVTLYFARFCAWVITGGS